MADPRSTKPSPSFLSRAWGPLRTLIVSGAVLALIGAVGVGAVLVSGAVDVSVRRGLIVPLGRVLPFVRDRSVAAHSDGVPDPVEDLDDPAVLQRAAAHYQVACVGCHGAPGRKPGAFSRSMLPEPPLLAASDFVTARTPKELYWVVARGLRHTGMPAWPTEGRMTEIWSMVALLEHFPDMSPERYRRLALVDGFGPSESPEQRIPRLMSRAASAAAEDDGEAVEDEAVLASCASCHGYDGVGLESGAFPNLTLLDEEYIRASLRGFQSGTRHSGIMATQVYDLSDEEVRELARYYGSRSRTLPPRPDGDPDRVARGRDIVDHGIDDDRGIAACVSCHGVGEETDAAVDEAVLPYPELAGQYAPYLREQLLAWTRDARGRPGDADPEVDAAHHLRPDEIEAVAAFYGTRTDEDDR